VELCDHLPQVCDQCEQHAWYGEGELHDQVLVVDLHYFKKWKN
jgi:hypothetical protein